MQAEAAQQGTPMLGFQRGFDFTTVDLWCADHSGQDPLPAMSSSL